MAALDEEHDVYVSQLQEVFDSCDTNGDGKLGKEQLGLLCARLHLEDQATELTSKLIGEKPDAKVTFDQFKEGFVAVLAQSVDGLDETSEEDDPSTAQDLSDEGDDISPKYVKGSKKYGRRSRPVGASSVESSTPHSDGGLKPRSSQNRNKEKGQTESQDEDEDSDEFKLRDLETPETFEAEGQLNQSIAEMENALDPVSEEEHLRAIWRDLGVGTDGYLTLNELATVCDHIGMDEMNPDEIQHLFDKLDVDSDGRVSFNEFLHGLFQHGGPTTPSATPVRPQSTPRQKLRMSIASTFEDRPQTPSFIGTISGLFSTIDVDNTGYASAEAMVELWEKLGVPHGQEILDYLQFESHTKISLAELSSALEQEMRTVEEDNAVYRAAVVSYQHELKHLKTISDTAIAERDKLKQDLAEANQRIALIVKEGDERQAASDQKREKELSSMETKYQEQIRVLQSQIDGEQEALTMQSAHQRTRLENEVARLKEEEARLREKLSQTQRELERLENDILEMAGKCADLEKNNNRQQRELEEASNLKTRLEELETNQAQIADEQSKWVTERLGQLESDRNGLKDKNDELTMEVEELRQQLATTRKRSRVMRSHEPGGPSRSGSILSDYQKPAVMRRSSDTVSSEEDEGSLTGSIRIRRKLPQAPGLFNSSLNSQDKEILQKEIENLEKEKEALQKEIVDIKESQRSGSEAEKSIDETVQRLTRNFSIERKDLEQAYKLEIADVEEEHIREKDILRERFDREKVVLQEDMEEKFKIQAAESEEHLRLKMEEEKRDILIKTESEKNFMRQQINEERASLKKSLEAEFDKKFQQGLQDVEKEHNNQLKSALGENEVVQLRKRVTELELQEKLRQEEMELKLERDRRLVEEKYEKEKNDIHHKYRQEITDIENSISLGKDGLHGKLKEDFDRLMDQHRAQITGEEQRRVKSDLIDHQSTLRQLTEEKDKLLKEYKMHSEEMVEKHRIAVTTSEDEHRIAIQDLEKRHRASLMEMEVKYEKLMSDLKKENKRLQEELKTRHEQEQMALEDQLARTCEELISSQTLAGTERENRRKLERSLQESKDHYEITISTLESKLEDVHLRPHKDVDQDELKQILEAEIQGRLEDDFLSQIERLRQAYAEERSELESQISLLKNELNEQSFNEHLRERQSQRSESFETIHKLQIEKINKINEQLSRERIQLEQRLNEQTGLHMEKMEEKEREVRHLEAQLVAEKRLAEVPITVQTQASAPIHTENSNVNILKEQDNLIRELETTASKVVELETTLALVQSEYQREIRELKSSVSDLVPSSEVTRLNTALKEALLEAEKFKSMWEQRASETNKIIQGSSESHRSTTRRLEEERDELRRHLKIKEEVLNSQVSKLREHLEKCSRRDILIKDLYVENANLIKSLYDTEKREKEVNSRASKLQDRCAVLQVIVQKVTHAALA